MRFNRYIATVFLSGLTLATFAGNPDRSGSSGGAQLLVNPWAKSGGLGGSNTASITGAEAMFSNVGGLASTKKTEIIFNSTNYLGGSDVKLSAIGFSQRLGESSVIGINVVNMNFGEIDVTTTDLPDGGAGTFKPTYSNIGLSYAKEFSSSISGGLTVRIFNESISDIKGSGVCLDAGIRYVTGKKENVHLGISLKNVGAPYSYSGDGIAIQVELNDQQLTTNQRADKFELPALVNIGFAYDFHLDAESKNILTLNGNFSSNSFQKDLFQFGADFGFKKLFAVRAGYFVENAGGSASVSNTNALTGLSAGFSAGLPIGEEGQFTIDYAYRDTRLFDGIHTIGVRLNL